MPPPPSSTSKSTTAATDDFYCEKFDLSKCKNDNSTCQPTRHLCERHFGIEPACFALWTNSSEEGVTVRIICSKKPTSFLLHHDRSICSLRIFQILHKGCWTAQTDIKHCSPNECVTHKPQTNKNIITYFCCCEKPNCNDEIYFNATSTADGKDKGFFSFIFCNNFEFIFFYLFPKCLDAISCAPPIQQRVDFLGGVLFVVIPIICLAVIAFVAYTIYRRCKFNRLSKTPDPATRTSDGVTYTAKNYSSAPTSPVDPLEMIDVKLLCFFLR